MTAPRPIAFVAASEGEWRIDRLDAVTGDSLPAADRLAVLDGPAERPRVQAA